MDKSQKKFHLKANIDSYLLLRDMLLVQKREFGNFSSKKADGQLNLTKVNIVNRVLEPLKEILKEEPSYKFLDILNSDELPTYSDVVLIISQYETAMEEFKKHNYLKDEYKSTHYSDVYRWMTLENPPDFYKNRR